MAEKDRFQLLSLLVAHYEELRGYLTRRFDSAGAANDTLHDIYIRLQGLQTVPEIDNPRAYLFRVANNVALDRLRVARRAERRIAPGELANEQPSAVALADAALEQRERVRLLAQAIAELPPRCREAFLLHKIDGLSHSEVARRLGISRSMVEKHVMKALAHCRDRLMS